MSPHDVDEHPNAPPRVPAPFTQLLGANLLSAVGSLPQHIAPLIVLAVVASDRLSVATAGWVVSASALGDFLVSLALPAVGLVHLSRPAAIAAGTCLLAALAASMLPGLAAIITGFFVIGACCGVLKLLGTMAASQYRDRTFAFILRLAVVLAVAGITCTLLAITVFSSWEPLIERLIVILLPPLVVGGCLYRPLDGRPSQLLHPGQPPSAHALLGLVILYVFFVGISGFLAYVAQQAAAKGMPASTTILSIGAMKMAAAVWLFAAASLAWRTQGKTIGALETAFLVAALWGVFLSRTTVTFFAAFLLLEIALNGLSARLQAAIVGVAPHFSGRWLNGVILLGAATGPPLYGLAITAGFEAGFVVISSLAVCLPLIWQRLLTGQKAPVANLPRQRS